MFCQQAELFSFPLDRQFLCAEIRLTVDKKMVSANYRLLQLLERPNQKYWPFSLTGLRCTAVTPDCPVLISLPARAAPLCAVTGRLENIQPLPRKQATNFTKARWNAGLQTGKQILIAKLPRLW